MSDNPTQAPPIAAVDKQAASVALTGMSTILNAAFGAEPTWAKPAIAILAMAIFATLIVYAHLTNSADTQMLDGGAMTMAGAAVSYYLGSSSGSAHKTAMLAAAPAIPGLPSV